MMKLIYFTYALANVDLLLSRHNFTFRADFSLLHGIVHSFTSMSLTF